MFGKCKLKAEIARLNFRVSELEERICPCESHSWKRIGLESVWVGKIEMRSVMKCRKCGKTIKTMFPESLAGEENDE